MHSHTPSYLEYSRACLTIWLKTPEKQPFTCKRCGKKIGVGSWKLFFGVILNYLPLIAALSASWLHRCFGPGWLKYVILVLVIVLLEGVGYMYYRYLEKRNVWQLREEPEII